MNTSVDVLAVLIESADILREDGYTYRAIPLEKVHAVVADLIDKVDSYVTLGHSDTAYRELSAALSRVRGVA